jgi:hypothetical protein
MSDIKIPQGAVITIELPGLTALRIDTKHRLMALDGISGNPAPDEAVSVSWQLADLRDGIYGDFHRLLPADRCGDADCRSAGEHDVSPEVTP